MIYEEQNNAVFINYPSFNKPVSRIFLSSTDNYRIIVKMKNHFEYVVPSSEFYNAIGGISHHPVIKIIEYIDIASLDVLDVDLRNNEANSNDMNEPESTERTNKNESDTLSDVILPTTSMDPSTNSFYH